MKIQDEIKAYCKLNGIKDVKAFTDYLLKKAFYIEKYGMVPQDTPSTGNEKKSNESNRGDLSDFNQEPDKSIKKPRKSSSNGIKIVKND